MRTQILFLSIVLWAYTAGAMAQRANAKFTVTEHRHNAINPPARIKQNTPAAWTIKMDSLVKPNNNKTMYEYDNYGNLISEIHYFHGVKSSKSEWFYDEFGNETAEIDYDWNATSNKWIEYSKKEYIYTYSSNKNQVSYIYHTWDKTTGTWVNGYKWEYTYDSLENKALYVYYKWNGTSNNWLESGTNDQYIYDGNGNVLSHVESVVYGTTTEYSKAEYTYDSNGELILMLYYTQSSGIWVSDGRVEYTYDSNGNLLIADGGSGKNENGGSANKEEYRYDDSGNLILCIGSVWERTSKSWVKGWRDEFIYDIHGNITSHIFYGQWDETSNNWQNANKYEYSYDTNNFYSNLCSAPALLCRAFDVNIWVFLPFERTLEFLPKQLPKDYYYMIDQLHSTVNVPIEDYHYFYDDTNEEWYAANSKSAYYYSPFYSTAVPSVLDEGAVQVFPNPVKDLLHIKGIDPEVKLYNLQGTLLLQSRASVIDISAYQAGVYIVDVNGEKIKVVKE
jgi:hypothetical protein